MVENLSQASICQVSSHPSTFPVKSVISNSDADLESSAPARTIKKDRASKAAKHASNWTGTSGGPKAANKLSSLREGGVRSSSNPPTPTETSSSEEDSTSDEESEYEEVIQLKDVSEVSYTPPIIM